LIRSLLDAVCPSRLSYAALSAGCNQDHCPEVRIGIGIGISICVCVCIGAGLFVAPSTAANSQWNHQKRKQ
jgi:hypothetical protein